MIAQLLNQDFLTDAAADTQRELKGLVSRRERRQTRDEGPLEDIDTRELQEVVEEFERVMERLAEEPEPHAKDDWVCMPREPLLAILQSELEAAAEAQRPEAIERDPDAPTDRRVAGDDVRRADGRRAFGHFEVTRPKILSDPRWVWSGVVIAWHTFKHKADFGGLPDQPVDIADDARILLVGDWGSGLERAQAIARRMRAELDRGIEAGREQHVVHLGDVYYTGAEREYRDRFLAHWPVRRDEGIGSYTLAGNHDMYRGGHAFYATCLTDPRFALQRGRSVFALRSPSWQLLGLDTAYDDAALHGDQAGWIRAQRAAAPDRRTGLLSHHQLFSAYEDAGEKLRPLIAPVLDDGGVDAWFWAHEHRCLAYDRRDGIGYASCVGHGGIPEYLIAREGEPYPDTLRYDYRLRHGNGPEPWNTFGFAVLDLAGPRMTVRYIDEHGTPHHEEDLRP